MCFVGRRVAVGDAEAAVDMVAAKAVGIAAVQDAGVVGCTGDMALAAFPIDQSICLDKGQIAYLGIVVLSILQRISRRKGGRRRVAHTAPCRSRSRRIGPADGRRSGRTRYKAYSAKQCLLVSRFLLLFRQIHGFQLDESILYGSGSVLGKHRPWVL